MNSYDSFGYSCATIRAALIGDKSSDINWFEKGETKFSSDYKQKSVISMMPSDLVNVLKAPKKYTSIYTYDYEKWTFCWQEETVNDFLFLLSPREMGFYADGQETSTFTYSYYIGATDQTRIKHQINVDSIVDNPIKVEDGEFTSSKYSYAGYNFSDPEVTYTYDDDFGGYSWMRSSNTTAENNSAWRLAPGGFFIGTLGYSSACPIAPGFCL